MLMTRAVREQGGVAELVVLDGQRPIQSRQGGRGAFQRGAGGCGAEPLLHVAAQQLFEGDTLHGRSGFEAREQRIWQLQRGAHAR